MKISRYSVAALLSLSVLSILGKSELTITEMMKGQSAVMDGAPVPLCERKGDTLMQIALDPKMRLAFENDGGLVNGGVCWWHNRFQRAAWFLAEFAPNEPRPTDGQVRQIVDDLARQRRVVTIPGYSDLYSFSRDFEPIIQAELAQWQKRDGFVNQAWLRGLMRKSKFRRSSRALKHMNRLYSQFLTDRRMNRITWMKLQMPGVIAHSALLLDMQKTSDGGYELKVVDSNRPGDTLTWRYRRGGSSMETGAYGPSMPYSGYGKDSGRIAAVRNGYCKQQDPAAYATDSQVETDSQMQIDGSESDEEDGDDVESSPQEISPEDSSITVPS